MGRKIRLVLTIILSVAAIGLSIATLVLQGNR